MIGAMRRDSRSTGKDRDLAGDVARLASAVHVGEPVEGVRLGYVTDYLGYDTDPGAGPRKTGAVTTAGAGCRVARSRGC
jgi:hypothetical protein